MITGHSTILSENGQHSCVETVIVGDMELNHAQCYAIVKSRDQRYDGRFFSGVLTTGIYCRPICPAPLPRAGDEPDPKTAQVEAADFEVVEPAAFP